ncbi:MAG TPA: sigma-54 dependent transcriptional regulator [Bryobacteraceae bacterium]|nr:sigma-54 dependent transcriptional regulator [Bryobacteraceae bacterium]
MANAHSLSSYSSSSPKVLLVEDEADAREFMAMAFRCEGYAVELAEDGDEAVNIISERHSEFSAVFLEQLMARKDGLAALREIRSITRDLPVFITSFAASPGNVVEAIKAGATDLLSKPLTHEDLRNHMLRVAPPSQASGSPSDGPDGMTQRMWGSSRRMREIQNLVRRISVSDAQVLIEGETGVGKEVLAREIHAHSRRARQPFLKLNCAALPSELVESELFGYERGAFTGAFQRKAGMFELADRGTILLDEIGDMDFKLQAKLLMVLQDHEFQRLGGKETVRVNVRVMAATHRDLHKAIQNQTFREDLYYRLNVVNIHIPPLRDRREDILPLANRFLSKHGDGSSAPTLTPAVQQAMLQYQWPGNVRELENLIQRFLIFRDSAEMVRELAMRAGKATKVAVAAAGAGMAVGAGVGVPMDMLEDEGPQLVAVAAGAAVAKEPGRHSVLAEVAKAKAEAEAAAILEVLESTHWNRKRAAQVLNIDYKALLYKMRKLSIGTNGAGSRS